MPPKKPPAGGITAPVKTEGPGAAQNAEQPSASTPVSISSTPTGTPAPPSRGGPVSRPSSSARGKPAIAPKPKFAGRRSATARAELEAAEAKKKEAEAKAAAEQAKKDAKDARKFGYRGNDRGGRGGGRGGRGRGGHMGDAHRQRHESNATGVFGGGQASAEARSGWGSRRIGGGGGGGGGRGTHTSGGSGGGSGTGGTSRPSYSSGGMGIKNELDVDMGGMRPIKVEEGGYISSDEDEAEGQVGPKQDIDQLQIIDLTGDEPPLEDPFAPVRLSRVPHKERAIGLTVEEDSPESSDAPEAVSEKRKGKQKAKDVEFTGSSAIPKRPTTYSSSETEENEHPIKQESTEDERQTRPRTPDPATAGTGAEIVSPSRDLPVSPESRRRAKARIKATADALDDDLSDFEIPDPPRFQTQAEKDEWDRQYDDLRQIRVEFGRQIPKDAVQPDAEGDTAMAEANAKLEKLKVAEESRNQNVYIFQFPPVLPDLMPVSVKPEPGTAEADGEGEAMDVDQTAEKTVEVNDDESKNTQPKLPSGNVGKLRIHKSGKATLDWGGTSLILGKGADATFLQNVLIASVPDGKPKEGEPAPEDQEPAVGMGMGQIRGKFVFTPNWTEILR
ncbi:uncharacterized protein MYCFIDRAFT_82113 [Pseudocercospora fijiensis CIRAD86]|uniref:Uncharacterized protein n=1 Tax=Pseudocercospora fijiensis (strain CIRAD86) TaxID=383855 RepID=M2Z8S6_PSEFD|nr:uncharacterized protein MYCFIDRAFT_82113 [Pseudocercospora fijiensis CIRAD86]EME86185.1 hypothetical protein MYCFIDRAFT_82113 [Pseudocercospora fijiensis CIRAD86]